MQNRERVGESDPAPSRMNIGPATACDIMEGRVELVVPCGKAYFESEESLSNFLSNSVSYTCTLVLLKKKKKQKKHGFAPF